MQSMQAMVMDDDATTREKIANTLGVIGFQVRTVQSSDEAAELAQSGQYKLAIFDINMGPQRPQEGLDALEKAKALDREIFVGIYSQYGDRYKARAEKLDADAFRSKTGHREEDVLGLVTEFFKTQLQKLTDAPTIASPDDNPRESDDMDVELSPTLAADPNYHAAIRACTDSMWYEQHRGEYVAFVGGAYVHGDRDQRSLLRWLDTHHPQESAYIMAVDGDDRVIDFSGHYSVGG